MKTVNSMASACRHCRYYSPEGRRGGHCQQLNAPVRGTWKACSLAIPQFAPSWNLESMLVWEQGTTVTILKSKQLQESLSLGCAASTAEKDTLSPVAKLASNALLV